MSIQYRFVPIYDNLNEDSEKVTGFYPKVVSRGTINKERMFEEISRRLARDKRRFKLYVK